MARKVKEITITGDADNRDAGKTFQITEMSAMAAERWATRAFLALARSGVEIPDDIAARGLQGVAALGWQALSGIAYHDAEPLLAEMLGCVQIAEKHATRKLTEDDVEEIATYLTLRKEVFALHVDFSKLAGRSNSPSPPAAGENS